MNTTEKLMSNADRALELLEQKSPHQLAVELAELQRKHDIALAALNKMQDQRDQLVAQFKDASAQCVEQASLLREAQRYVRYRLEYTECDARIVMGLIADIDEALAGKLPEQHTDDAAVDRFAIAMKAKLATAREKGRGGWDDPSACSVDFLAELLVGHVGKGNPGNFEDIANLAMMLHQRSADPAVLAGKVQGLPLLSHDERSALMRFKECCEDGQGYDVEKEMMVALARKGALHHRSAGYYEITEAGSAMLAAAPEPEGGE